jgi:ribulose-phosphate 3-epimerase
MHNKDTALEIIPAVMPDSLGDLSARATNALAWGALSVQVDIMDGDFVPNTSWPYTEGGLQELESLRVGDVLPEGLAYEAHLMVRDPKEVGLRCIKAGFGRIVAHIESFSDDAHAHRLCEEWRRAGAEEIGIALLLATPTETLEKVVEENIIEYIQVMGIAEIGFQGHVFDERTYARIAELHEKYPQLRIAVDGGVSEQNIAGLVGSGATRLVVGSAIAKAENPAETYRAITEAARVGVVTQND